MTMPDPIARRQKAARMLCDAEVTGEEKALAERLLEVV